MTKVDQKSAKSRPKVDLKVDQKVVKNSSFKNVVKSAKTFKNDSKQRKWTVALGSTKLRLGLTRSPNGVD